MSAQPPPPFPPPPGGSYGPPPVEPPPDNQPVPGQPPTGWTPTPLAAVGGAASYAPHTETPGSVPPGSTPGTAIKGFAPKRSPWPLLLALVGVLVAALLIYSATRPPVLPSSTPTASPHPSPSASKPRDGTSFTLENSDTAGVWKIADKRWTSQGLNVLVEVRVDTGSLAAYFNALSNNGQDIARSQPSQLTPAFPETTIEAGSKVSGWVFLPIPRGTTLVFLRTATEPQVSGIEVAG